MAERTETWDHLGSQHGHRKAAILDRYLPEGYSADPEVSLAAAPVEVAASSAAYTADYAAVPSSNCDPSSSSDCLLPIDNGPELSNLKDDRSASPEALESSLKLQGGDIHRDMFKIKARANSLRRSATFSHQPPSPLRPAEELSYPEQREPGGFRRQHLQYRARQRRASGPLMVAKTFVDFLDLYGSFAGEDLEDADTSDSDSAVCDEEHNEPPERLPLLGRPRRSSRHVTRQGDASTVKTFFTLLKAFIGTGIMFLPKAFCNGGILFSSLALVAISLISCLCFRLLLECRQKYGGGYGELGATIVGPHFRNLILASIALSQLGFVCAGLIFTAENLGAVVEALGQRGSSFSLNVPVLIALQVLPLVPLTLIRNISKLGPIALLADAFILLGLGYIWYYDIQALAETGLEPSVQLFNSSSFTVTIGSAIFTFEGIGLILPIQSSMKNPRHFDKLLYSVMLLITLIFTSVGALCYATFGETTKIQVISNFPQDSLLVNTVQILYSLAVLGGEPVQLFPAIRIIETTLFGERATGKRSTAIKWKKNGIRTIVVVLCVGVGIIGATDLDKFVALIGSFACVPLVYIYPAYLHYAGAAEKSWTRWLDMGVMTVGFMAMVYTTLVTVAQWVRE